MRQQVRRHERAVAVPADGDAIPIGDAELDGLVDGRLRAGDELLDVLVVGRFSRPYDRHRWTIEDRVALREEQKGRVSGDAGEPIRRPDDLTRRISVDELLRICPQEHRDTLTLL